MKTALAWAAWLAINSAAWPCIWPGCINLFCENQMNSIRTRQLPGRQEALRAALKGDASQETRQIAGLAKPLQRQPPASALQTFTFTSGVDQLPPEERAALPF